jgi:diguanylate cyclase (GGDEF)-like protein/PAS domain S-box-containing protein
MLIAPRPANEAARLRMLRSLGILDTPAEEVFDRVTRVVSQLLQVPIALVSLVDENRQWFKSRVGMAICETDRDIAFCSYALEVPDILVIEDTTADPRFIDNPLVTGEAHIRFYAGVPLRSEDGLVLGTLCALDTQPRSLPSSTATALRDLAAMVQHELLQRSVARDLQAVWQGERSARSLSELRFAAAFQQTPTGQALISLKGRFIAVNPKLCELTGYSPKALMSRTFSDITHPDDHDQDSALVVELLAGRRQRYSLEKRYLHRDGHPVWVEINVALVRNDLDQPDHFIAAILDISARKKHEALLQHHQEELEAKVIERTQELSSSRETLQVITDNLPILIAQVDRDLCYRFNNDVYRQIFGVSPASLLGQSLTTVLRPDLFEELQPYFQRALAGERVTCEAIRYSLEQDRLWSSTYVPDVRNGQVEGFFVMSQDVTERVLVERSLLDKAMLDPLTELPNRRALQDYLQARVQMASVQQQAFALFFLDLDGFKAVNDVHGHDAGDALLRQVAGRLKGSTRKEDFVCRLAGDEFVVIANGVASQENAQRIAEVFCELLAQPFEVGPGDVRIGVSLGISLCPAGALTQADTVLAQADGAMYAAKRRGRNGYHFAV